MKRRTGQMTEPSGACVHPGNAVIARTGIRPAPFTGTKPTRYPDVTNTGPAPVDWPALTSTSGTGQRRPGEERELTAQEFNLLWELASHAGTTVRHERLIDRVWGGKHDGNQLALQQAVKNLRRRLGDHALDPAHIAKAREVGCQMNA